MKACLLLLASTLAAQTIVVSPQGPIRTLVEARDAARAQRRAGRSGNIDIRIAGGTYFLGETLVLTPEDSYTTWEAATGAHPTISGGRIVAGWKKAQRARWTADATGPEFRQLFISGRRAQRSRTHQRFLPHRRPQPAGRPMRLKFRGSDIKKAWEGSDAEVIALLAWAEIRMPIVKVDEEAHIATLSGDPRPPIARPMPATGSKTPRTGWTRRANGTSTAKRRDFTTGRVGARTWPPKK